MAWEERVGGWYYYRKHRVGRRIVSEYVGAGFLADVAAAETETARQEREAWAAQCAAEAALDRQIGALWHSAGLVTHGHLLAAGYWQHKRQWRKRQHGRDNGGCNER